MSLTDYQSQYIAYELTRRMAAGSDEALTGALVDAQVDLNPHQIDAALFAFQSPLSTGALLADEVGLGKTIEAGLVISQHWAERRRRVLVITPANLRKQWFQELTEKFFLPCYILESKSYNAIIRAGGQAPFHQPEIIICSYQFARAKAIDVQATNWDLVVIDEAHRLRNVYKPSNVTANALKTALAGKKKLLLTATPLQNSLLELFGLVSFIDDYVFGDLQSFREQYVSVQRESVYAELKARLAPLCHRTLRRQVLPYIRYTQRLPLVERFVPDEREDLLYDLVSEYLRRPNLRALPASQRQLLTLVFRKLLASSTFAIAGALETVTRRLERTLTNPLAADEEMPSELTGDYEGLDDIADEWEEGDEVAPLTEDDQEATRREIAELKSLTELALSIDQNTKGSALLVALERAFLEAERLGAPRKAIIFTESRRTQDYLVRLLAESQFNTGIVLFNGSNSDERSRVIYADWLGANRGSDRVTGSRTADMRSALVDYFRTEGQIMIATEAGAEGINLQFCSLVVNYDLPWNPQRIEQRIGRCHRYGQQHDVVVVNFLNQKNAADQRVFELLAEKFNLFEGVFGASDEVLGAIESGVDFEKRIADIYQRCRLPEEIQAAFDQLQVELSEEITDSLRRTRQELLTNFDDEVREKLRVRDEVSREYLNRYERLLMQLTRHELREDADFLGEREFDLRSSPVAGEIPLGRYELPRSTGKGHLYRSNHPLATALIERAGHRKLPPAAVIFDYTDYPGRISDLEPFIGQQGWLSLSMLMMDGTEQGEDHLLLTAVTSTGDRMNPETAARMLTIPALVIGEPGAAELAEMPRGLISRLTMGQELDILEQAAARNAVYFDQEIDKLDAWADDRRVSLRRELKAFDLEITALKREAKAAGSLPDKLSLQRRIKQLEVKRDDAEFAFRAASREIEQRKSKLIDTVEARLAQQSTRRDLFTIQWSVQ